MSNVKIANFCNIFFFSKSNQQQYMIYLLISSCWESFDVISDLHTDMAITCNREQCSAPHTIRLIFAE